MNGFILKSMTIERSFEKGGGKGGGVEGLYVFTQVEGHDEGGPHADGVG